MSLSVPASAPNIIWLLGLVAVETSALCRFEIFKLNCKDKRSAWAPGYRRPRLRERRLTWLIFAGVVVRCVKAVPTFAVARAKYVSPYCIAKLSHPQNRTISLTSNQATGGALK